MRTNNEEKIAKIQSERIIMLNRVKNDIKNGKINLSKNIDDVNFILNLDDKNSKEYKSIIKAQELIVNIN